MHSAPVSLERDHGRDPNLGVLMCPRCVYPDAPGRWPWAADNGAFSAWSPERFERMLGRIKGWPGCLFVTAPDVVGDSAATLDNFAEWYGRMAGCGQPIALVGQDGMTPDDVPWFSIRALFIGGSTLWKMGEEAAEIAREAKRRGKWLHMGRVNTKRRVRYAQSLNCDSIDGTNFSMFRQTNLPWALAMNRGRQMALGVGRRAPWSSTRTLVTPA